MPVSSAHVGGDGSPYAPRRVSLPSGQKTVDLREELLPGGVRLTEVRSTVTGDIDLNGVLGLNRDVRNGFERITVRLTIKGDAPAEKLREIVEQSRARSAVYDIITNRVPVTIKVDTH